MSGMTVGWFVRVACAQLPVFLYFWVIFSLCCVETQHATPPQPAYGLLFHSSTYGSLFIPIADMPHRLSPISSIGFFVFPFLVLNFLYYAFKLSSHTATCQDSCYRISRSLWKVTKYCYIFARYSYIPPIRVASHLNKDHGR